MAFYFAAIVTFAGALWWYNHQRQARLNADPAQQRLAAMLVAAVLDSRAASKTDLAALLASTANDAADRRVRLTHAVLLVRSQASPEVFARVLALSRAL